MRYRVEVRLDEQGWRKTLAEDARRGLSNRPKSLPPKYFYDAAGCALFDRITELPEYYLTRHEERLIRGLTPTLMGRLNPTDIVELGSGSPAKICWFLDALDHGGGAVRYVPLDGNHAAVERAARDLTSRYEHVNVHGIVGDFERHVGDVPLPGGRRLVLFLGSTIGNLDPPARRRLFRAIHDVLGPGGRLLLGLDLVKDRGVLEAAYDDTAGVTGEFNRNILRVVNRGLDGDFDPEAFRHRAFYNAEAARIEMHLVPDAKQVVRLRQLGLTIQVEPGESIWTESSYKFTRPAVESELAEAGLQVEDWYADGWFALALIEERP